MKLSLTYNELSVYIAKQLNFIFPDNEKVLPLQIISSIKIAIDRLDYCFSKVINSRYNNDSGTIYNHLYSDHNIVFYWFLANTVWIQEKNDKLSSKLYYLNKVMHGFDCMFDTGLPEIFLIFHGVGTMLGKAVYGDYFIAMQGCTIGSHRGNYPILGKAVALTANSSIIGNCKIGDKCNISTGIVLFEKNMNSGETVFVNPFTRLLEMKLSKQCYAEQFFKISG